MENRIDKKVLEYVGIYKTKKPTQEKIDLALKAKEELTKLTNLNIERVYIVDEYAWEKNDKYQSFCFLTDVRIKEIDKKFEIVKKYAYKTNINILFWSMCQFEKRKSNPTELDYYIENYGNKIYDSGKLVDIDERVKTTRYAAIADYYRYIKTFQGYNPEAWMRILLQIYSLKMDYPINEDKDLAETIEYVKYISQDKYILTAIKDFNKKDVDKFNICERLEKYIKKLKQIRPAMVLENEPSMKIYERYSDIKNKGGEISISNLTKENLYIMEVIQRKMPDQIAELFNTDKSKILGLRKKFGYKVSDSFWYEAVGDLVSKAINETKLYSPYDVLKRIGIFNFERHTYSILSYINDGQKYLLKEFWKLTDGERHGVEKNFSKSARDVYFRAYLCAELLKQNGFIEETEYLTYRITKKGKKLMERLSYRNIDELNLIEISNITGKADFYGLSIIKLDNENIFFHGSAEQFEEYKEMEEEKNLNDVKEKEGLIEVKFEDIKVKRNINKKEKTQSKKIKTDYKQINLSKEKVGKDSEELIYNLEKEKLLKENRSDLAQLVFWESKENGDGAGYDIRSYEKKNEEYVEIYIEVKGTNKSVNEPFEISKNEIETSNKYKEQYYIYRVGNVYTNPKFYKINGRIKDNFSLEATSFKARKK